MVLVPVWAIAPTVSSATTTAATTNSNGTSAPMNFRNNM